MLRKKLPHLLSRSMHISACLVILAGSIGTLFAETHLDTLRRGFANYRLGQFLHYGMNTFSNSSGTDLANQDPQLYNPTNINPAQWVSAAKAAGIKFMVLVCKHHDGFANWDTHVNNKGATYNPYGCMNSRVPTNARKDVVKLFYQACHDSGIVPGLYFSVQDRTWGGELYVNNSDVLAGRTGGRVSREALNFNFTQIKELLSYGDIPFFVDDGWAWSLGHTIVPYQEFQDTLRKFGPNTLFSEHEGLFFPWHEDCIYYENSKGVWPPATQKYASWLSGKMTGAWYWLPGDAGKSPSKSVATFISDNINRCDPVWCNNAPNLPPGRDGQIQDGYVSWLKQLGQTWKPPTRPDLPTQGPHMDFVVTAVNATGTSNSANAHFVMDGVSDGGWATKYEQYMWTSSGSLPQSVTVDLGAAYYNIEMCNYRPKQIASSDDNGMDSSAIITGYKISYSLDNTSFTPVTLLAGYDGTFASNNTMKDVLFQPVHARYMKFEATSVRSGSTAIISELDFGGYTRKPNLTGVKVAPTLYMPSMQSDEQRIGMNTMVSRKNQYSNSGLADAIRSGNSIVYYGVDGRKLYQSGTSAPILPGVSSSKVMVYKVK